MIRVLDPVSMATGAQVFLDPLFSLLGLLPISVRSIYHSDSETDGAFGRKRHSEIDATISIDETGRPCFLDEENYAVHFERPAASSSPALCNTARRLRLYAEPDGAYTLKDGRLFKRFDKFERTWRVARIEDRNGTAIRFERNVEGRLEALVTPEHLRVEFRYDGAGLRTQARLIGTDSAEREIMRWAYDGSRRLIEAVSIYDMSARYAYDEQHRLVSAATSDGHASRREYDAEGRVTAVRTNGPFDGDRLVYDDEKRVTTYLPGGDAGKAVRYYRDEHDTIVKTINACGAVKQTVRAPDGEIFAEVDGNGDRVHFIYDEDGNVAARTDAEGRTTRYRWDRDRNLEKVTDGEGRAWEYGRDDNGNLVAVRDPLDFRADIVNDSAGQPTATMRHDGLIERRTYDEHLRLREISDFRGGRTVFDHDGFGRIVASTDPLGATTKFSYEDVPGSDFWSPAVVTRPDGVTLAARTHDQGRRLVVTDGEGYAHTMRKGPCGVLTEIEGPKGAKVRLVYDGQLRLVSVVNQNGHAWTFDYDPAGRVVRERDVDGLITEYAYDDADRRIETRRVDGTRIKHEYDRSGLLLRSEMREPDQAEPRVTRYRYDRRGFVVGADNDDASVAFERDAIGRIAAETINGCRIESTFDCCGNRTSRRVGEKRSAYAFDPLGGLQRLESDGCDPLIFTRDLMGRELSRQGPHGFRLEQSWDAVGQLLRQRVPTRGASRSAVALSDGMDRYYYWTRASAPRAISDSGWGTTTYAYDANDQVVQAQFGDGATERFRYDSALNVVASAFARQDALPWKTTAGGRVEAAHGPKGQEVTLVYDVQGRVVERRIAKRGSDPAIWRYRWDGRDRMIACISPDGGSWSYGYDAFARRVWKRRTDAPADAEVVGQAFLWDHNTICQDARILADGSTDWANAVTWHFEPRKFKPLAFESAGDLFHVVADHLGTPREVFDGTGKLVVSQERHLWGMSRRRQVEGAVAEDRADAFPLSFQGQFDDPETGLSYNRFRYYDPMISHYVSPDPIGLVGGLRPHGYVHAPTVWVDPSGLYGVYLFETTLNNCYVGKGMPDRMETSMAYRTKAPPSEIKRCLYSNTDADAAAAGVDPNKYGAMVENQLIGPPPAGYGANVSPDWFNAKLDGQAAFGSASPTQQAAATATASSIKSEFGPCP